MIYARCVRCKKRWNIAIGQRVPKTGYICPHCAFAAGSKRENNLSRIEADSLKKENER